MRKACRGMLCAAGLLLMGTETAWAQTDTTAPTLSSSTLSRLNYQARFSEVMTNSPATTDLAVSFAGTSVDIDSILAGTYAGGTATRWIIVLSAQAAPMESVTIAYTKPGTNPPQDSSGNALDSFSDTLTRSSPSFSGSAQPNELICEVKYRSDNGSVFPCKSDL